MNAAGVAGHAMNSERLCLHCRTPLPDDAGDPVCLRCALASALETEKSRRRGSASPTSTQARVKPSSSQRAARSLRCPACSELIDLAGGNLRTCRCPRCGRRVKVVEDLSPIPDDLTRPLLGRFRLLERIGSGGFGSVWKAWDEQLKRVVAVKVPRRLQLSHHEQQRFLHEARAAARLRHRYILDIHEVGFEDDEVFLVSDYLPGGSLADLLARSALTPKEAARLCQKVAEGLHAAHEAGIIHRDVKPQNILLDEQGEPRLADFELALPESGEISVTIEGNVLGTPAYMSPEQAAGHSQQADRRSDVYSLGVVLYQMLSGQLPFRGNWTTLASQIANDTPPSPRKFQPHIPADLERICLKCLEKDPRRRYPTAAEFAEELGRFLRGEPVLARPVSHPERIWRWAKRRPAIAALAAMVTVLTVTILVGAPWMIVRLALSRHNEHQSRLGAEESLRRLEIRRVRELFASDRASEGLALLSRLVRENPTQEALASWLKNELTHRNFPRPLLPALEHPDIVNSVQFSPDGSWLLTVCRDNTARIFDVASGELLIPPLQHDPTAIRGDQYRGGLHALHADINPDGTRIATASCDGTARLWDAATGEALTPPLVHPDYVSYVRFSPDGKMFVTCCKDGMIRFWETASGEPTGMVLEHRDWANSAEFSADGRLLVTTSDDKTAQVWEVESGARVGKPMEHAEMVQHACFSPDGHRVLTATSNDCGGLWSVGAEEVKGIAWLLHENNVPYDCFSPDGCGVATASFDGTAHVWGGHHGESICALRHRDRVRFVQFSSDGLRCLTASEDGTARIWDSQTGQPVTEPLHHAGTVWCARFSPDGRLVATASADATVQLWDVRSQNALVLPLPLDNRTPQTATWSADSRRVATAGSLAAVWDARSGERFPVGYHWHNRGVRVSRLDASGDHALIGLDNGIAQIWSVTNPARLETEIRHPGSITALAFTPDERRFVTASTDGSARVWDRLTGEPATPFLWHGASIKVATLSSNGKYLLTGGTDGRCMLWDTTTGDWVTTLPDHTGPILDGRFSDDGRLAITGSQDHTARLWEIPGGAQLGTPLRHLGPVHSVELTRDTKWALTASEDKTARVWESMTSQPTGVVVRHEAALVHAEFDPTDTWVLTASKDGVVRVSEVATGHPVCEFAQPGRSLRHASFSPDGKWVLIASDGWATIRRVLRHSGPTPEWLPMLGEAVAQQRLTADDQSEGVPSAALLELKGRLQTPAAPATFSSTFGAPDRPAQLPNRDRQTNQNSEIRNQKSTWDSWFFGEPTERSFAPDAAISAAELAERLLKHTSSLYVAEDRLDLLKAAFALDPANAVAFAQLTFCRAALDLANFDRTLPMLDWYSREALRLSPEAPRSWWARAIYLERCGRLDEATKAVERARALGLPEASFQLSAAAFLVREGRSDEASTCVVQARQLLEADPDALRRVDCRRALCAWAMDLAQRDAFLGARSFALRTCGIADRPPETPLRCLDLTAFYNAPIDLPWIGRRVHHWDLKDLPKGAITISETDFDVRGVVQLSRGSWAHFFRDDEWSRFYRVGIFGVHAAAAFRFEWPAHVSGIPVGQPCRRLHLLLGTHDKESDGVLVANVTVHYADGQKDAIPIEYGTHVREWIVEAIDRLPEPHPQAAWTHRTHLGDVLQLFIRSWENPRPDVALDRLDLESTMTESAPFVVAITVDP